jgi:hypothetical protein
LHGRRVHVRRFDHVGRERFARERRLHPVVRVHGRQGLRERRHARLRHPELKRRQREYNQQPGRESGRQSGPTHDAVDDPAPDPALAVVAALPADERNPNPVDPVAEPREQRG